MATRCPAVRCLTVPHAEVDTLAVAWHPQEGWVPTWIGFRVTCRGELVVADIQIPRVMHVDCGMASKVAEKWALGGESPFIAGPDIPWECEPASTGSRPLAGLLTTGYVACGG